jgi:hypothetical protein
VWFASHVDLGPGEWCGVRRKRATCTRGHDAPYAPVYPHYPPLCPLCALYSHPMPPLRPLFPPYAPFAPSIPPLCPLYASLFPTYAPSVPLSQYAPAMPRMRNGVGVGSGDAPLSSLFDVASRTQGRERGEGWARGREGKGDGGGWGEGERERGSFGPGGYRSTHRLRMTSAAVRV